MVLTAVLAAGVVVSVLLVMTKKAGAPVSTVLGLATAVAAVAVAASRADAGAFPPWWLPVAWLVSVLGVPLALADARHHRLPDVLTLPAYPAVALTVTLASLSGGGWRLAAGAALGCLLFGGTHLIVHRLSAGGLGPGDVKLAGSFGAVLGAVGGLAPAVAAVLAATVSLAAVVPTWLARRIRQARELRASAQLAPACAAVPPPGIDTTVAPSPRSETEGEPHEPTSNQPDLMPSAANPARPSAPTDLARTPSLTDLACASGQPAAPTDSGSSPTGAASAPSVPAAAPAGPPATSTDLASAPPTNLVCGSGQAAAPAVSASSPTAAAAAPTGRTPAPASLPPAPSLPAAAPAVPAPATTGPAVTSTGLAPAPAGPASTPPRDPARSRIRAGPLRVPYGPGLVLATWACAVFPAAGTGIG